MCACVCACVCVCVCMCACLRVCVSTTLHLASPQLTSDTAKILHGVSSVWNSDAEKSPSVFSDTTKTTLHIQQASLKTRSESTHTHTHTHTLTNTHYTHMLACAPALSLSGPSRRMHSGGLRQTVIPQAVCQQTTLRLHCSW